MPPKTTQRGRAGAAHDLARRFAKRRRRVDAPLARDDEVERRGVEPDRVEYVCRPRNELGAERRERGAEPTRRAGAGLVSDRHKLFSRRKRALELRDHGPIGALLRAEEARGFEQRRRDVARDERRNRQAVDDL